MVVVGVEVALAVPRFQNAHPDLATGRPAIQCVASKWYGCWGIDEKDQLCGELEVELYANATSPLAAPKY